nr:hypothetical protein [Candidatus Microthrix sp.]
MAASQTVKPHRRRRAGLLAVVGIALLALAPVHPAGAQTARSWDAFEQVTGANGREYIADSQGRALQLRGVNIKTGDPADGARDEVLDAIAARGFNLLRLSVFWGAGRARTGRVRPGVPRRHRCRDHLS